jgi:glycosyl transferase family 25
MKILVINLDRSPKRLQRMAWLLSGLDLAFDRVSAVDGRKMDEDDQSRWVPGPGHYYRLRAGEIGCFLSHRKCWEIAARGEADEYTTVLEDDILLGKDANVLLSNADWIPADADIVKLETNLHRTYIDRSRTEAAAGRKVTRLRGRHTGTAGYAISSQAAAKLLSMSETFSNPVDHFLFNPVSRSFHQITIYQLTPAVCVQAENIGDSSDDISRSTLHPERRKNRRTGVAKLKRELKRPLEQGAEFLRGWTTNLQQRQTWDRIPFE